MSQLRLAASPTVWSNELVQRMGGYFTLDKCLSDVQASGLTAIEEGHKMPTNVSELKRTLDYYGLRLACGRAKGSLAQTGIDQEFSELMPKLQVLKMMKSPYLIYQEDTVQVYSNAAKPLASRPKMSAYELGYFARKLEELAKRTQDMGVELVYRAHLGTLVQSAEEIDVLMGKTETLKLAVDTAQLVLAGADVSGVIHSWGNRLAYIQMQDLVAEGAEDFDRSRHSYADAIERRLFTAAGNGSLDFFAICRALKAAGSDAIGMIAALKDPAIAEPYAYTKLGREHVLRCAERCELQAS